MTTKFVLDSDHRSITCHAWNKDFTRIAISPNDNLIQIYKEEGRDWKLEETLDEHTSRVTGIDWAPNANLIVSCGADRNAYVWIVKGKEWRPTLVLLRINRAATCVKWSPLENKFAVGSGSRLISVCHFDGESNWWVSKHIKKPIRSTITTLDWHPENTLLACGCSDFKARIFSACIKEVDHKPKPSTWSTEKEKFGNMVCEFSSGVGSGWVHNVRFSPNGEILAWLGHDSSISIATNGTKVTTIRTNFLPFLAGMWLNETNLLIGGHDCTPMLFKFTGDNLTFVSKLDVKSEGGGAAKFSAMKMFRHLDTKGQDSKEGGDAVLETTHQNSITDIQAYKPSGKTINRISTTGIDGQLVIWDLKSLEQQISELRL
jgi:actin related protein 2/3 complex subunit 1A/1B